MLWPILRHLLQNLVVHVFLNPGGCRFRILGRCPHNGSLDRTCSRERLCNHLRLEPNSRFCQHCGVNATRSTPRLCTLVVLHTQDLKAFHISVNPVLTGVDISIHQCQQVTCKGSQLALVHELSEVIPKVFALGGLWDQRNLYATICQRHAVRVLNLNLQIRFSVFESVHNGPKPHRCRC